MHDVASKLADVPISPPDRVWRGRSGGIVDAPEASWRRVRRRSKRWGFADGRRGIDAAVVSAPAGPVVSVRLEPAITGEDPWARVGLHPGELLDSERARTALATALASSTFAQARASLRNVPGGVELLIDGERRIRVREVALVGAQGRSVDSVRQDFGIPGGRWVTDADMQQAVDRLRASYVSAGWGRTRVDMRLRDTDDPSTRVLIVQIDEGPPTRIRRVVLDGVPTDEVDAVRSALTLSAGDIADPHVARRVQEPIAAELRRAGYFTATVQPIRFVPAGGSEVDAVVTVQTGARYRLDWTGIEPYPRTAVEAALRIEEERGLAPTTINVLGTRARDFFVRRGFLDAEVNVHIAFESPAQAVLRFDVRRGEIVRVRSVSFQGVEHMHATDLLGVVHDYLVNELPNGEFAIPSDAPSHHDENLHPGGELSGGAPFLWTDPEATYVPDLYVEASHRIALYYRERGFLDAAIAAPQVQRAQDLEHRPIVDLTYTVTEGPRTILDEVMFENNESVASETLTSQIELRLGVPLSFAALDAARIALVQYYQEQGHVFAQIDPQVDRSPDRTRARVRFVVHEGPEVRVGHIVIRGNQRTPQWVILQRVDMRSGELLRPSHVRTTQRRLGELAIFSSATVTPVDPDIEAPVKDLVIQVNELRPQYLELRAGFSTGQGLRAGIHYGYRNIELPGLTLTAAFDAQLSYLVPILPEDPVFLSQYNALPIGSRLIGRATLSLLMPAFASLGPSWRGTVDFAVAQLVEIPSHFELDTGTVGTSLTYRPQRRYSVTLTPEFQGNQLTLLGVTDINTLIATIASESTAGTGVADADRLAHLLLLPTGTTWLGAARLTGTLDFRDQVFNPTRGLLASATIELVHIFDYVSSANPMASGQSTQQIQPGDTIHLSGAVSGYYPLPGGIVLATSFRAGINIPLFSAYQSPTKPCTVTYTNRLFFLGGEDSMRAWYQDSFVPQDVVDSFNNPNLHNDECSNNTGGLLPSQLRQNTTIIGLTQRGGDIFYNWRNEIRIPDHIFNSGLGLGLFVDLGDLWKQLQNFALVDRNTPDRSLKVNVRMTIGFGLRYTTPIGPVALDFGFNPFPQQFERVGTCCGFGFEPQFSIGIF